MDEIRILSDFITKPLSPFFPLLITFCVILSVGSVGFKYTSVCYKEGETFVRKSFA